MSDVTEKNNTAEITVQSAADYEYKTLMRLLGVSVSKHLLDEHFTVIWANDFYYGLIGWPKDEYEAVFHNHCDAYYGETDREEWERLCATVVEALQTNKNGYNLVSQIRRKNGEYVWVKFNTAFADEYVDGIQVAYTIMTNIDDLIKMQREQSITYDNLPGFVAKFRVDEGGFCFMDANDRFRDFFDCHGQEGLPFGLSNLETEKNRKVSEDAFPVMRKGKPVHFTLQAKDVTGKNVWLQVNADCIDRVNGVPIYLVIYIDITDITEQRELQKQLEERSRLLHDALEAAEKANKAKSEFLSRMSHDIRTPMNAIMGMTSIAASHVDNRERVLDCLSKIEISSKLLLSLINEVLDMSKIESGRITMSEEEFSLSEVLQSIVTIIHPSIMEKGHSFDIHAYGLEHELVIGDPRRIEQVFLNILSNAVKYTPDHGNIVMEIRECPSNREGYGYYEFVFCDNGYGMKPEFLDKIFTPFERAKDTAIYAIQGTGLGMAISKNIVNMMDGDIRVESGYGKGSKFTVSMYLKLQDKVLMDTSLPEGLTVLVVDDDQIACETTCERLRELGLSGEWVLNGKDAVKKAEAAHKNGQDYFTVIMDMKMPGMDGLETAEEIRKKVGEQIPIILLSAYDWTEYEEKASKAGIDGFVSKPMLKSGLLYAIKRFAMREELPSAHRAKNRRKDAYEGKRLLLVEDNELNQEIAIEILSQTGATVEVAENGLEAVEKFSSSQDGYYSMIFMDLQMPVMGGIEAACRIRALDKKDAKTVPIVAMTANVFAEDVAEVKAVGMNAHLAKPLEIDLIDQVMAEYIK